MSIYIILIIFFNLPLIHFNSFNWNSISFYLKDNVSKDVYSKKLDILNRGVHLTHKLEKQNPT